MSDDATIAIKLNDKVSARMKRIEGRLNSAGRVAKRLGATGSRAFERMRRYARLAGRAVGAIGRVGLAVGRKLGAVFRRLGSSLISFAKYAVLAGAAFAGWQIKKGVDLNARLEQYRTSLSVLLRSQSRAKGVMKWIMDFSTRTPFQIPELVEAATQLEAFGLSAQKWLPTIGNLAAASGKPLQEVAQALAYLSTGRVGEAGEALARMGVNLRKIHGLQWNKANSLVTPLAEAIPIIKRFLDTRYGGMMARQSKTFSGALSTLKDKFAALRAEITKPLFDRLKGALTSVNKQWDRFAASVTVRGMVSAIQNIFNRAADSVERMIGAFNRAYNPLAASTARAAPFGSGGMGTISIPARRIARTKAVTDSMGIPSRRATASRYRWSCSPYRAASFSAGSSVNL